MGNEVRPLKDHYHLQPLRWLLQWRNYLANETNLQLAAAMIPCMIWQHWHTHTQLRLLTHPVICFPACSFLPVPRQASLNYEKTPKFLFAKVSQKRSLGHSWLHSLTLTKFAACYSCWWVCPRICCISSLIFLSSCLCPHLYLWGFIKSVRLLTTARPENLSCYLGVMSIFIPSFIHQENSKCRIKQLLQCDLV